MVIDYSKFIQELANRTMANYNYISNAVNNSKNLTSAKKRNESEDSLYEVTQLINSMFSLIIVPEEVFGIKNWHDKESTEYNKTEFSVRERRLKKYDEYWIVKKDIENLIEAKRLKYTVIEPYNQESPVCSFINSIRNAMCHDGVGFLPVQTEKAGDVKNEITDIIFETKSTRGAIKFITIISVEELGNLVMHIAGLYCKVEEGKTLSDQREYRQFFEAIKEDVRRHLPDYKRK